MKQFNVSEVAKVLEELSEKMLCLLEDDEVKKKYEESFKNGHLSVTPNSTVNYKNDMFKAKILCIKKIKEKSLKLFKSVGTDEKTQRGFFDFLKSMV